MTVVVCFDSNGPYEGVLQLRWPRNDYIPKKVFFLQIYDLSRGVLHENLYFHGQIGAHR